MKSILLLCILLTLQIDASISKERSAPAKNFTKQVVHCPGGSKSFILSKDDVYYSASHKKFLFIRQAGRDSCKTKNVRAKKGTTVCTRKTDMYKMLKDKISNSTKNNTYASCLKLNYSANLTIIDKFPFTTKINYYQAKYKDKVFYISSQDIYKSRKYTSTKHKKRLKKKINKKYKKVQRHKKIIRKKSRKRHISKPKKKYHAPSKKPSYVQPAVEAPVQEYVGTPETESLPVETNMNAYHEPVVAEAVPTSSNTNSYEEQPVTETAVAEVPTEAIEEESNTNSSSEKYIPTGLMAIQDYTYRCVATYGENRITVDNSDSMSAASDSTWRRCQALKADNEVCKIQDCYKLIK